MNKFKKTVAFTIILCTLLSSLAGCNDSKDNDLSDTRATTEQTTVTQTENISTEAETEEATSVVEAEESTSAETEENESTPIDYSQISNLPYIYQQVLDNKKSFILYGDEMFIDEYKSPYLQKQLSTCNHVEYSILDMDGNGDVELLIKGWTEDILVLHIENDIVYGYDFTFRGMYNVEEDGSFCWNNNAGNSYGVSKLVFKNQECNIVEIYRVENDNTYYVNNKEVSKEEFDLLITNRENVNQITWYDMATYPKQIDGKILYNDWDFPECAIYQDNNGEFFVHIKAWNIYRKIDLSSIKWEDGYGPVFKFNSFSISDDSASIAIYNYDTKYSYISIYHIEKGTLDVQEYSAQFEATSFYECAEFGINMIDEQITYFFLYGETNPDYKLGNSFIRFETFDGGKSWGDPQNISKDHYKYYCEKMEFLTKDFGYCIHGHGDVFSTLLTTDGGSTWEHAKITFPFDVNDLITYKNIKMTNNQYILTVTVHTTNTYDLQYISTDFVNWTLCEPQ